MWSFGTEDVRNCILCLAVRCTFVFQDDLHHGAAAFTSSTLSVTAI